MRTILLLTALSVLAGCGIKKPLIPPREIPAYEQKREEKLRKRQIVPELAEPKNGTN